jgi:hypothetical protein
MRKTNPPPVKQPLTAPKARNLFAAQATRIENKLPANDPKSPGGAVLSTAEIIRTANMLRKAGLIT